MTITTTPATGTGWLHEDDCRLGDLIALAEQHTDAAALPHAASIECGVPIYDTVALRATMASAGERAALQAELAQALMSGPGIVVFRSAFTDRALVERTSAAFTAIIDEQRRAGTASGDHFATPGANDRVWNALEKLARRDPATFVDYYANDVIALVATAWLGPCYQVTSQVNVVNPGGAAQSAHVDYHLGFQSNEVAARYPAHVHRLSPVLTLQGAVAHGDMPVESGPTMYLPHSQKHPYAYLAWRRPEFREYFDAHHVQLPLACGDAVFFIPSLLHAAGHNRSADIRRMANLLQVSSAFGRAMETVDRDAMVQALYPVLLARADAGTAPVDLANAIAASAEGYPFPTNLDRDPPLDGLAPQSQADLVQRALTERWEPDAFDAAVRAAARRRRTTDPD